jgi:hypothetical protein
LVEDGSETHSEGTLHKVYQALLECDLSQEVVLTAINNMQNAGILFRERA